MSSGTDAPPSTTTLDRGPARAPAPDRGRGLTERYRDVRSFTEALTEPLTTEDMVVQSRENVSPTKWHLAHVSWFFETFLLEPFLPGYEPVDETYAYRFNSYYVQAGERHRRDRRGCISRPTVVEVLRYREHVDRAMARLLEEGGDVEPEEIERRTELGIHHEQQHQELLLIDIRDVFSVNPCVRPTTTCGRGRPASDTTPRP